MKKIILFGATGNVGSYVLRYAMKFFEKEEYEIIASGRRETDFFSKFHIKYVPVDIVNELDFEKLPKEDVYAVIDLAAVIPSYMDGYRPREYVDSNIIGCYNVLEYCRRVHADRILFSTTCYDVWSSNAPGKVVRSDEPYSFSYKGDHAVYVITKNASIELIKHYYEEYGLKYFIFRFPTIYNYSPYHYYYPGGVKTIRPVYRMIERAMKGEEIELWGDPSYSKDMVYVDDCAQMICRAVCCVLENGWYNVGTGVPVTLEEQIKTIIDVFSPEGNRSEIVYCPEKPSGGGILMDVSNAREELGYAPKFGVRELFEAYKEEMKLDRFKELRMKD